MNINQLLREQIELIKLNKETMDRLNRDANNFVKELSERLKKNKIIADVFIGGSLAKKTIVKKDGYDIDIFVRFDKKYKDEELSDILGKVLDKSAKRIHGSRDYYQQKVNEVIMEIIPVIKIAKQQDARNIMDLSYFHVAYINKTINKNKKLSDEIILTKTFAHAQDCYGAESYIHGFSGYSLELIICYYGGFLKFIKEIVKSGKNKIIIDSAKFYKNNNEILRELNESKINSPIILIDPTFKERNALAGLSDETFERFKEAGKRFLKNPSSSFFNKKDIQKELKNKYGNKLIILGVKTNKQAGDIAGSKSKKFFEYFCRELNKDFKIKINEFNYNEDKNTAYFFIVIEKKNDELIQGPPIIETDFLKNFKKAHSNAFVKGKFAYVKIKHDLSFNEFVKKIKTRRGNILNQMSIREIKLM
ncbi:MAG: nucleotidyltransferase domain-containing protein [Candidatus Pacearchaeota archaeon]|jgi:tRNA nucleotidyltransferase (CCA-adding enzyme)